MSTRSRARQVAIQVLFQHDLNPDGDAQQSAFIRARLNGHTELMQFCQRLLIGVNQHCDELDSALQAAANNWSVPRMAATDRSILRLATFELLYTETPHSVVINEAIELARRFGSNQSAGFVNGILDRVFRSGKLEATPVTPQPTVEPATGPTAGETGELHPDAVRENERSAQ